MLIDLFTTRIPSLIYLLLLKDSITTEQKFGIIKIVLVIKFALMIKKIRAVAINLKATTWMIMICTWAEILLLAAENYSTTIYIEDIYKTN